MSEDRKCTLHGTQPDGVTLGAPQPIDPLTGMHKDYYVICDEDRAKGFVRPVRDSYRHVGLPSPRYSLRDLTEEEHKRYDTFGYVKYEEYPETNLSALGRFWTQEELNKVNRGCQAVTSMNRVIAETYARDPYFYGSTFCATCRAHLRVGEFGEFVWMEDGTRVGT